MSVIFIFIFYNILLPFISSVLQYPGTGYMCVYCYCFRVPSGLASADWQPAADGYKNIPHSAPPAKGDDDEDKVGLPAEASTIDFLSAAKPQQIHPVHHGFLVSDPISVTFSYCRRSQSEFSQSEFRSPSQP